MWLSIAEQRRFFRHIDLISDERLIFYWNTVKEVKQRMPNERNVNNAYQALKIEIERRGLDK